MDKPSHPSRRAAVGLIGAGFLVGACDAYVYPLDGPAPAPGRPRRPPPDTPSYPPRSGSPRNTAPARPVRPDDRDDDPASVRPGRPARPAEPDGRRGVVGILRDGAGRPVEGVMVRAQPLGQSPGVPEIAIFTDDRGRFHWPLRAGRYRLTAERRGRRAQADVRVPASGSVSLTLVLR